METFATADIAGAGVVVQPSYAISDSIKAQVARVLAEVPADKHAAIVTVATMSGVNVAFAYRVNDTLQVAAWVGKSGWAGGPIDGGAVVKATF